MKIRIGFVSNSSSASFILHTRFLPDEMHDVLVKDMTEFFNKDRFKKELEKRLAETQSYLDKHNRDKKINDMDKLYSLWEKEYKQSVKRLNETLKGLEKISIQRSLVDYMLSYYNQDIITNQMGFACFSGYTTMYNDDNDMGEVLCAIRDTIEMKYGHNFYMIEVNSDN